MGAIVRGLGFVAVALLVMSTNAAAQLGEDPLIVTTTQLDGPIIPLFETREVTVDIVVSCAYLANPLVPAKIALDVVEGPDWVIAAFAPPSVFVVPPRCPETAQQESRLLLALNGSAPAHETATLKILARGEGLREAYEATTTIDVTARWVGTLLGRVESGSVVAAPRSKVTFPIEIGLVGNGRTVVLFETGAIEGWQIVTPAPIVLTSKLTDPVTSKTVVDLVVYTPYHLGQVSEARDIDLIMTPVDFDDREDRGEPERVTVHVIAEGWYVDAAPTGSAATLVALVALATTRAMGRRRPEVRR